jgi:hypothetical protein
MKDGDGVKAYPISSLPKSWQEDVRFMGCGNHRDAEIVYLENGHSGRGYYVYCREYPEEGMTFLGKTNPTGAKGE